MNENDRPAGMFLLGCDIPESYGGPGGDFLHNAIVTYEMTAIAGGGPSLAGHSDVVVPHLVELGTEEQKRLWLPCMAAGEAIGAVAMTEPSAGNDLQTIRTTARKVDRGYEVIGQKVFITNGLQAHFVIVACKTDNPSRGKNITLLLMETDRLGLQAQAHYGEDRM